MLRKLVVLYLLRSYQIFCKNLKNYFQSMISLATASFLFTSICFSIICLLIGICRIQLKSSWLCIKCRSSFSHSCAYASWHIINSFPNTTTLHSRKSLRQISKQLFYIYSRFGTRFNKLQFVKSLFFCQISSLFPRHLASFFVI